MPSFLRLGFAEKETSHTPAARHQFPPGGWPESSSRALSAGGGSVSERHPEHGCFPLAVTTATPPHRFEPDGLPLHDGGITRPVGGFRGEDGKEATALNANASEAEIPDGDRTGNCFLTAKPSRVSPVKKPMEPLILLVR